MVSMTYQIARARQARDAGRCAGDFAKPTRPGAASDGLHKRQIIP